MTAVGTAAWPNYGVPTAQPGYFKVTSSVFKDNFAKEIGGAVYASAWLFLPNSAVCAQRTQRH